MSRKFFGKLIYFFIFYKILEKRFLKKETKANKNLKKKENFGRFTCQVKKISPKK